MAFLTHTFTARAHARLIPEYQMNNPAFARTHGIELKRRVCFADALGGNLGG
jgi:hypothetical protein